MLEKLKSIMYKYKIQPLWCITSRQFNPESQSQTEVKSDLLGIKVTFQLSPSKLYVFLLSFPLTDVSQCLELWP